MLTQINYIGSSYNPRVEREQTQNNYISSSYNLGVVQSLALIVDFHYNHK